MRIVNIGCGTKTSDSPDVVNVDWSAYLRIRSNPILFRLSPLFLDRARLAALRALPNSILVHDLRKGIPFPDDSVDAVYHSHFLSHLDRDVVPRFFAEVRRVLKPGGVHRLVVLDMEKGCRDYLSHLQKSEADPPARAAHDRYVADIIELMVRKEAYGTSTKGPLRRLVENSLLGDARRRGETLQWMYDRINLPWLLGQAGFHNIAIRDFKSSAIEGWCGYGLDRNDKGGEYKPGSLYVEGLK